MKLQINLSQQNKLIFSKNWLILSKCLTKQYHSKNKKSHNTKINDSIVYKLVSNKDKKKNVKIGILFPTLLERKKR